MIKSLLVVPSYFCDRHCKYCMFNSKTYDTDIANVDYIISTITSLIANHQFADVTIGNGGNLSLLGVDYIDNLLGQIVNIVPQNTPISAISNLDTIDDVKLWSYIIKKFNIRLYVSLNSERPFNKRTEELLLKFDAAIKTHIGIITVCFKSVYKQEPKQFLDYIENFKCSTLTVNEFEHTAYDNWPRKEDPVIYYQYMTKLFEQYVRSNYSFVFHDLNNFSFSTNDYNGSVDIIVDNEGIKCNCFNNGVKSLQKVHDVDTLDSLLLQQAHKIGYNTKCLCCKYSYRCPELMKPYTKSKHVCDSIINMFRTVDTIIN